MSATRTATKRNLDEVPLPVPFGGAIKDAIEQSEAARHNALPFVPTTSMALARTPTRILFWSFGGFVFTGVWFAQRTMELAVPDLDSAGRFAAAASPPPDV